MIDPCAHEFVKVRRWPAPKNQRYRCRQCGMTTRLYDATDQAMTRPIHLHMSVAFPSVNVVRKDGTLPPSSLRRT